MFPDEINAFLDLQLSQGLTLDAAIDRLMRVMMVERRMNAVATAQALLAARVIKSATAQAHLGRFSAEP